MRGENARADLVLYSRKKHTPTARHKTTGIIRNAGITRAKPLRKPYINEQQMQCGWAGRVGACVSYQSRKVEYAVSPKGLLRNWTKNLLLIALLLLIPAALLLPVMNAVGWQIAELCEAFMMACQQLFLGIVFLIKAICMLLLLAAVGYVLSAKR